MDPTLRPVYTYRLRLCVRLRKIDIVSIEMDRLMGGTGSVPIPSVKWSVSIGTLINFDRDGHGDDTCKQVLNQLFSYLSPEYGSYG